MQLQKSKQSKILHLIRFSINPTRKEVNVMCSLLENDDVMADCLGLQRKNERENHNKWKPPYISPA